ncbi:PilN domain-containing protein [Pantoea sp. B65]|uniref:PilN domain-containing protein n=1 Tax=Pantoea sp. B65 TaxID=2813359 RepID=UPI0039B6C390
MVWVNLLPWRERQLAARQRGWLLALLAIWLPAAGVLTALYQQLAADNLRGQLRVDQRQAAILQIDGLAQALAQVQQQRHSLLARQQQQQRQQRRNQQWQQFAQVLPQLMPPTLWLTSLQQAISGFHISGFSLEVADVTQFRQQLSRQPLFQQVSHGSIERQAGGMMGFSLLASLREDLSDE